MAKFNNKPIFTLGHSNSAFKTIQEILCQTGIQTLVDVRSYPFSEMSPNFDKPKLREILPAVGITYHHLKELGGKGKRALFRSPNTGLGKRWQGYADYMLTEEFEQGMLRLLALITIGSVVVFCAEENWTNCHRRFISDILQIRGYKVIHLDHQSKWLEHTITNNLEVRGNKVIYPAIGEQLSFLLS